MKGRSFVLAALLFVSGSALAREISGVDVPETLTADGKPLKLNGAGMRKKFIIKVYVGSLYLQTPASTLAAITSSDQPWVIHMHFVRSVDKEKIISTMREGFEKNNPKDKAAWMNGQLDKVVSAFADMKEGHTLVVTYLPGKGTTVGVKGGATQSIEGKEFGDRILQNWIGKEPADESLKEALLGGK